MLIVESLLFLLVIYLLIGLLFAISFVFAGASRIDSVADDASFVFRAVIIPGAVLLWPILLIKWVRA
jgi:hypothetical protein